MKALVVYDSTYGNTKDIAESIAREIPASAVSIDSIDPSDMRDLDLLVVGSPTQAGGPTGRMKDFLKRLKPNRLQGVSVAAFDTRFDSTKQNLFVKSVMKVIGYAAPRIADGLRSAGGDLIVEPHGFIVNDTKGPVRDNESESAMLWANALVKRLTLHF